MRSTIESVHCVPSGRKIASFRTQMILRNLGQTPLQCTANYKGSSQAMETSAALDIWNSSIAKHKLVYGTYIGDGDSSSFRNLMKSDHYNGEVLVKKEECLGHAQKRLKKHLLKKSSLCKGLPRLSVLSICTRL